MKRLVVKAQLRSLQEELRSINTRLYEIHNFILKNQNELTEYDYIKLTNKVESLETNKKEVLTKLKRLEDATKSKGKVEEYGRTSFYNLVAFMTLPVTNSASQYYIKIYEVVTARQFQSGAEDVYKYVVTLTSGKPSNSENYFSSNKKPLTELPEVISYSSEVSSPGTADYIEEYIEKAKNQYSIAFGQIDISSFGKSFDGAQLKSILGYMEKIREEAIEKNKPNKD